MGNNLCESCPQRPHCANLCPEAVARGGRAESKNKTDAKGKEVKTMKNVVKLIIAYWVIKNFVFDNDLLDKMGEKIKSSIKSFLE